MSTAIAVKVNTVNENPFYGMRRCLSLYQKGGKGSITEADIASAWIEANVTNEKREMFFILLFSIGDIAGREHNLFKGNKIDSGGNSQREAFMIIMDWLKKEQQVRKQFKRLLTHNIFNEYVGFDVILASRVKTKKKSQTVEKIYSAYSSAYDSEIFRSLVFFCASIINGNNPAHAYFLAKYLTVPRVGKRSHHKKMLPATRQLMKTKEYFLKHVCTEAGLPYAENEKWINFYGYRQWRKQFNGTLESVLFSTRQILKFDEQQFLAWLNTLPAQARYRVKCRLLDKEGQPKGVPGSENNKWNNLATWFIKWENFKEEKQKEQRVLEEKIRQTGGTDEEKVKLEKVKKQAKVTVGGIEFASLFSQIIQGSVDAIKLQPFLDKISLPYNSLVFVDDSGSMFANKNKDFGFTAFDFAAFLSTICLMKNPDDSGRSLIGMFSAQCRLFSSIDKSATPVNSIIRTAAAKVTTEPLIQPTEPFLANLERVKSFMYAHKTGNGTNIGAIPQYLQAWVGGDQEKIEQLMTFPVWTIITDGNWNNMSSPEASMNDFMMQCERYFGFKPFIIAIDASHNSADITRFQGIHNFMYIPPNPAQIEQLLTNFKDMDIMDIYTPLQSLHRSNRYAPVKNLVL